MIRLINKFANGNLHTIYGVPKGAHLMTSPSEYHPGRLYISYTSNRKTLESFDVDKYSILEISGKKYFYEYMLTHVDYINSLMRHDEELEAIEELP